MHSATSLNVDRERLVRREYRTLLDQASSSQVHLSAHGDILNKPKQLASTPNVIDWHPGDKKTDEKHAEAHSEDDKVHQSASSTHSKDKVSEDDSAGSKVNMSFQTVAPSSGEDKGEKDGGKAAQNLLGHMDSSRQIPSQLVRAKHGRTRTETEEKLCGKHGCHDFCAEDFPLGVADSNACTNEAMHTLILERAMCEEAAMKAGAHEGMLGTGGGMPFEIPANKGDFYPRGCFKMHGQGAYFYNEKGAFPKWPMGIPVCQRFKFANGTADTNVCPDTDFQKIMDEDTCRGAALCQGYCVNDADFQFGVNATQPATDTRMPDAWDYDSKPAGCFIHPIDNCVYFNVPRDAPPAGPIQHSAGPIIPLCNVSNVTYMDAATIQL